MHIVVPAVNQLLSLKMKLVTTANAQVPVGTQIVIRMYPGEYFMWS